MGQRELSDFENKGGRKSADNVGISALGLYNVESDGVERPPAATARAEKPAPAVTAGRPLTSLTGARVKERFACKYAKQASRAGPFQHPRTGHPHENAQPRRQATLARTNAQVNDVRQTASRTLRNLSGRDHTAVIWAQSPQHTCTRGTPQRRADSLRKTSPARRGNGDALTPQATVVSGKRRSGLLCLDRRRSTL